MYVCMYIPHYVSEHNYARPILSHDIDTDGCEQTHLLADMMMTYTHSLYTHNVHHIYIQSMYVYIYVSHHVSEHNYEHTRMHARMMMITYTHIHRTSIAYIYT